MLEQEIKNDVSVFQQVRIFIEQLRHPFGFLQREIQNIEMSIQESAEREAELETHGDHKYFAQEKRAEAMFDAYAQKLATRYNVETIPWLEITRVVVWIFLGLTMLVMLKRPAFMSITVAGVALYVLDNPQNIGRQTFRGLVLLLAASWVYDFITLFLIDSSSSEEDEEDGGQEAKLRRFTRLFSYINLLFKVIVVLVFWKDSLDFRNIIRRKRTDESEDIDSIVARFEQV